MQTENNNQQSADNNLFWGLHQTVQNTYWLFLTHECTILILMVAAEHPAKTYPSEPNIQAAVVTQRCRTCSEALRPGPEKTTKQYTGDECFCLPFVCEQNKKEMLIITDKNNKCERSKY